MRGMWALLVTSGMVMGQELAAQQTQYKESPQLQTRQSGPAQSQAASQATATPVPQTPRQVLVEILKSKDGSTLERHLPEITKKKMKEMGGNMSGVGFDIPSMFGGISMWTAQAQSAGSKVDIEEAGPVLMTVDDPKSKEKLEVTVENDDLAGDEDDIQLGFRATKAGEEDVAHWFAPKILLHMKQEQGIWRFEEIGFSAKAPIGDPDFLDAMAKQAKKQQAAMREFAPQSALQMVNFAEAQYFKKHGTYSCSQAELDSKPASASGAYNVVQYQMERMKEQGYELRLSGCSASEYTVTASPVAGTIGKAFCSDQTRKVRFAADGKAETCVERGEAVTGSLEPDDHITGIAIDPGIAVDPKR